MPINFEQIATLARERDRANAEEEQEQRDSEKEERLRRTQAGIKQLDDGIVPLLESAKQAFEKEEIPCSISHDTPRQRLLGLALARLKNQSPKRLKQLCRVTFPKSRICETPNCGTDREPIAPSLAEWLKTPTGAGGAYGAPSLC